VRADHPGPNARTPEEFLLGTPKFRTDLYSTCGTLLSHDDYIELVDGLGRNFTPELKTPSVAMPFQGTYTQQQYAQQMIDAYQARGINPRRVFAQSFDYNDILFWIGHDPSFGQQAVFLDPRVDLPGGIDEAIAAMPQVAAAGVRIIAPPTWALVTVDAQNRIIPSAYARAAKAAGLDIITWTLERSGPLATTGRTDYYYQSVTPAIDNDGDTFNLLDVLARQVGVRGIFSDWPGTVTYYANCMRLGL
jgi:glycerophosphoryl diester phosphodiesterase